MVKNHGEVYTVKYLKASQLCIQKKLAGQPFKSLREVEPDYSFPRLSKSGLPAIIRRQDRTAICNDSLRIIRMWLSIFSLYRIVKIPFTPKLSTITDKFDGSNIVLDDFNRWLTINSKQLLLRFSKYDIEDLKVTKVLPLVKSSPLGSRSYTHLIDAYRSLKNNEIIFKDILSYIKLTNSKNLSTLFRNIEFILNFIKFRGWLKDNEFGPLGKLSFKEEAAGKLRVFAMVDIITQSLFYPLHLKLFSLFKSLPNDCTHDQAKGFRYAQALSLKYNRSFGFDLSAATDRLPISSQKAILNSLFGIGDLWGNILVNRDYIISKNNYSIPLQSLRYEVGQPMGALSSWAMLNLTHHMMIQFLAQSLGKCSKKDWYDQYIVLGDDLVLFDPDIAFRYQSFCQQLGVKINLSKSVIAVNRPVLEFAKRTSLKGEDVSALSFKELLSSDSFFGRLAVTTRLINNKWGKDLYKLLMIGNRRSRDKTVDRIYPLVGFSTQLFQAGIISMGDVLSLITDKSKPLSFFGRNINWMTPNLISKVVLNYLKTGKWDITLISKRDRFFASTNIMTFKLIIIHRIINSINRINKLNQVHNRINILDHLLSSNELEIYYQGLVQNNISLELDKKLTERSYFGSDSFKIFKTKFLNISSFANIFFGKDNSYPDLSLLRHGLDIDTSYDTNRRLWHTKYDLLYLNDFMENKSKFLKSKKFLDLELDMLLKHHTELLSLQADLLFTDLKTDLQKERLDNPLKVLDFIKEIKDPQYSQNFEFVKFENQIFDSEAFNEVTRGFKPKFDFVRKPEIKITFK